MVGARYRMTLWLSQWKKSVSSQIDFGMGRQGLARVEGKVYAPPV